MTLSSECIFVVLFRLVNFKTKWSQTVRNTLDPIFTDSQIPNGIGSQKSLGTLLIWYPNALNITHKLSHNHCLKIFSFG